MYFEGELVILIIQIRYFDEKLTLCGQKDQIEGQMIKAYQEGMVAFKDQFYLEAAKKFNEAEILFPQSEWAPKSALMAAYSYYVQDYYGDTIAELKRFTKVYPNHNNLDYALFLDEYVPFHPDNQLREIDCEPDDYYEDLNNFFYN